MYWLMQAAGDRFQGAKRVPGVLRRVRPVLAPRPATRQWVDESRLPAAASLVI